MPTGTMVTDTVAGTPIRVTPHYQGPPGLANGGWVSGIAAGLLGAPAGGPVAVSLRAPVRIGTVVTGRRQGDRALLTDGDGTVLVEAALLMNAMAAPPAFVAVDVAERAAAAGVRSPFPGCFVCGLERPGGLRITVGPTGGGTTYAGLWRPPVVAGDLPARYVWAALDCPTGLVHLTGGGRALLGRLTAVHHRAPVPGAPHVVVAQATGAERRKRFATAALYTAAGDLVAHSEAIWIVI